MIGRTQSVQLQRATIAAHIPALRYVTIFIGFTPQWAPGFARSPVAPGSLLLQTGIPGKLFLNRRKILNELRSTFRLERIGIAMRGSVSLDHLQECERSVRE